LLEPSEDVEFIGVRVDRPTQRQGISLDTDDDE